MRRLVRPRALPRCSAQAAHAATSLDELLEQTRNARAPSGAGARRARGGVPRRTATSRPRCSPRRSARATPRRPRASSSPRSSTPTRRGSPSRTPCSTQRLGSLGELFGVVRQVAGDGTAVMYSSLLSAQFPKRDEFFAELGKAKALPSIDQLERLWFEIQREMTESGRVARFRTRIVRRQRRADGRRGRAHRRLRRAVRWPLPELPAERGRARRARAPAGHDAHGLRP